MVSLSKFMMLNWPLVLTTTGILYLLIIISLPFSTVYATIFLFAIIAFWSRLPGVGMPPPFYFILYLADVIDIFSIIIAINVGAVQGAVFSLCLNIWSRLCGSMPPEWGGVISDSLGQFFACLLIPFAHVLLGNNIIYTVTAYTILRVIFVIPLDQIFYRVPWPRYILEMIIGVVLLFAVNLFYTKLFGNLVLNILNRGISFNWILFLFTTIIIIIVYLILFRHTQTISIKPVIQNLSRTLRRRFILNKRMKYEDRDRINEINEINEIRKNL
jgi:hypothetical protein